MTDFIKRFGPWAVITGASDGIGRQMATVLAARGLGLVLVARRGDRLEALAQELREAHGIEARVIAADLGQSAGVDAVVTQTQSLDVGLLVAAAGFGTSGNFADRDLDQELNMLDVNCRAVVALAHPFARRFKAQRRGGLVLMSSLVAFQGVPRAAHYAATKAFIQSFAEGLRIELAPFGVEVLASAPGPVASGFDQRADMKMNLAASPLTAARGTINALGRQGTVRPGFLAKFLELALSLLPRWGRVRVMSLVMGGMTAHQG